jgi:hypothetical protein
LAEATNRLEDNQKMQGAAAHCRLYASGDKNASVDKAKVSPTLATVKSRAAAIR